MWAKLNSLTKRVKSGELKEETFTIGRTANNDLCIKDQRLSGKHCTLIRTIDEKGKMIVRLEDSSSNGTYHNGLLVSH